MTNITGSALLADAIKDSRIRGEKCGEVKRLSGFKKGRNFAPEKLSSKAEGFVRKYGHDEIKEQAEEIYAKLKSTFGYLRKSLNYACEEGCATIKTPDFDVDIFIAQDPADVSGYMIVTELSVFRRPAVVEEDGFSALFSPYCDTILIELSTPLRLEDKIDEIEAIPDLAGHLQYPPDCSSFLLELPNSHLRLKVTAKQIALSLKGQHDLKTLIDDSQAVLKVLGTHGVALLPRASGAS